MDQRAQRILAAQMRILFRGSNSDVMQRTITGEDLNDIRQLDIELLSYYLPSLDEQGRTRALRTINSLQRQMDV